jgi:hypothetical protein
MTESPSWQIIGDWFDNCSCAVACPLHLCPTPGQRLLRVGPFLRTMALSPFGAPGNMPPSEMAMGTVRLLGQFFFVGGLGEDNRGDPSACAIIAYTT